MAESKKPCDYPRCLTEGCDKACGDDECDECEGTGRDQEFPLTCACPVCHGSGLSTSTRTQHEQ